MPWGSTGVIEEATRSKMVRITDVLRWIHRARNKSQYLHSISDKVHDISSSESEIVSLLLLCEVRIQQCNFERRNTSARLTIASYGAPVYPHRHRRP